MKKTDTEWLNPVFLQYNAELRQGLNQLAGHDPIEQAKAHILKAIKEKAPKEKTATEEFYSENESLYMKHLGYNQGIYDVLKALGIEGEDK